MKAERQLARRSRVGLAVGAVLAAAVLVPAQPAAADAPEIIGSVAPQSGPTAGGSPIRIYGEGFDDISPVTSVEFDTEDATDFAVIDDHLITAVVPAAAGGSADNNSFVDVKVTDEDGFANQVDGFFYTNATFAVTGANPPFDAGDPITTTLDGYLPNSSEIVVPEFNPLLVYLEQAPAFPEGAPPYSQVLEEDKFTDSNGDLTVNTNLADPFVGTNNSDPVYDSNIACPVNQTTANYLGNSDSISLSKPAFSGHCMVANGMLGMGTLERPIDLSGDPTPAAPTLAFTPTSGVEPEDTVTISGANWHANPFFGSSKLADQPGETTTIVDICTSASSCSTTTGDGTVAMTRYINKSLSGATLSGSIVVGMDLPAPCTTCFLRVRQSRPAGGTALQAFVTININN